MKTHSSIDLQSITANTSSNYDGDVLYIFLSKNAINNQVVINIQGNFILSTSFLNSSFGRFINDYGLELFKKNIKIKTNINTFNTLKDYINIYSKLYTY
jgi:hypothetical protein